MADLETISTLDAYDRYIAYIRHENELLHQRTTWFIALQTLTVAGFCYLINGGVQTLWIAICTGAVAPKQSSALVLAQLMPCTIIGAVSALAAMSSIRAALRAQQELCLRWANSYEMAADRLRLPRLMGGGDTRAKAKGGAFADALVGIACVGWTGAAALVFGNLLLLFPVIVTKLHFWAFAAYAVLILVVGVSCWWVTYTSFGGVPVDVDRSNLSPPPEPLPPRRRPRI